MSDWIDWDLMLRYGRALLTFLGVMWGGGLWFGHWARAASKGWHRGRQDAAKRKASE